MDSEKVIKRDNEYVLHTYNRNPVVSYKENVNGSPRAHNP